MKEFLESIKELRFDTVEDLYNRRFEIKAKYMELDKDSKELYKWYFYYQLCLLKNPLKELLWDFLNFNLDLMTMARLSNEYRIFDEKRKRIKTEEQEEEK